MIVLLDESVPHDLRAKIKNHEVSTTQYRGWGGLNNGNLLRTAENAGVEVFVTCDQNMPEQQNLHGRNLGIVVLTEQKWVHLESHLDAIQCAIDTCGPATIQVVDCS